MTEPRRSTVFDYSNLLLHPDGTRVYQKSTNIRPRIAKVAVRTLRNNWIARDAGGLGNILKIKNIKETSHNLQEDEEFPDLSTETDSPMPEDEGTKRKNKRSDGRKAKRQKFSENYDYLNTKSTSSSSDAGTESLSYEPSSVCALSMHINFLSNFLQELLKCIHRYASEYYTESGQLLNSSRDYRKQRKARRDSKEKEKSQRKGQQRTAKQYRDMYKVFDGSAILAIGQQILSLLRLVFQLCDPRDVGSRIYRSGT